MSEPHLRLDDLKEQINTSRPIASVQLKLKCTMMSEDGQQQDEQAECAMVLGE